MEEKPVIVFDDSIKPKIIKSLGFKEDKESRLIQGDGKLATSQDYESINSSDFGGVLQGSKIPIRNNNSELVKYFISKKD